MRESFINQPAIVEQLQVSEIRRIIDEIVSRWQVAISSNRASIINKFHIGVLINKALNDKHNGDEIMSQIENELFVNLGYKISKNRLYEMGRVARSFDNDEEKFEELLNSIERYDVTWSFLVNNCVSTKSGFLTDEDKKMYCEDIQRKAENIVKKIDNINEKIIEIQESPEFPESEKMKVHETTTSINVASNQIVYSMIKKPLTNIIKDIKKIIEICGTQKDIVSVETYRNDILNMATSFKNMAEELINILQTTDINKNNEVSNIK